MRRRNPLGATGLSWTGRATGCDGRLGTRRGIGCEPLQTYGQRRPLSNRRRDVHCSPRAALRIIERGPRRGAAPNSWRPAMPPALVLGALLGAAGYAPDSTFEKTRPPGVSQVRVQGDDLILPILVPKDVTVKRKVFVTEKGKTVEKVVEEKQPTLELVERKHPLRSVK